jgi:hypothetical protein
VIKAFFKWLFRIKPKAVKVDPVVEETKPTPGEHTLDVALGHINRIKPSLPGFVEKPVRPRVEGMPKEMAMPYKGHRGKSPAEIDSNRARQRTELQTARDHRFATQYSQPATPQDRTVDDLVMVASAIGMSSAFAGNQADDDFVESLKSIPRMGAVEAGGDREENARSFSECVASTASHRETPVESCYTPSRSEPEPSRESPSEPASSNSSNDSYGD